MMNPHNIREHKYKNGWRIAILQQPRAIWGSNEELRRQHKDTWVDTRTHTQERRHSDGNLYNTYILAEVTRTRQQNSSKQKREEGELPVVLSWSCQERDWRGSTSTKGLSRQSSLWPTMGNVSISRYWRNNHRNRCRKRHGSLNGKKHRNEKPFRRWIYKIQEI